MIFLLFFVTLLSIANLVILIYLSLFIVRERDSQQEFNSDLVNALGGLVEEIHPQPTKKGWEDKYEAELEARARKIRELSGLRDLPDPTINWGSPPVPDKNKHEGLTIEEDE